MPGKQNSVDMDVPGKKITMAQYYAMKSLSVNPNEIPTTTSISPTGTAQWEAMMKKFSQAHVETCRKLPEELVSSVREEKNFPTGSSYEGSWNALGMSGHGIYKFPNSGVIYVGEFDDGMFHGVGELRYESGAVLRGKWHKGRIIEKTLIFDDGLEYAERDWQYVRGPDRRFTVEINEGIEPAGRSHLTAEAPPPEIPDGYYDVGDGLYNPATKLVYEHGYSEDNETRIIRTMSKRENDWVMANCRTKPDTPVGPCQFLYEKWQWPTLTAPAVPSPPTPSHGAKQVQNVDQCESCAGGLGIDWTGIVSGVLLPTSSQLDLRSSSIRVSTRKEQKSQVPNSGPAREETEQALPYTQFHKELVEIKPRTTSTMTSTVQMFKGAYCSTKTSTINW